MTDPLTDADLEAIRERLRLAAGFEVRNLWREHYEYDVPRLLAEIERLREALQWIADYSPHWDERMEETMKDKAREALGIAKNPETR